MSYVTSIWSSYGHTFIGEDDHESCLVCGAVYALTAREDDPSSGDYHAANGDAPMHCSGDTGMAHGYPGERVCSSSHPDCAYGDCQHCFHDCNCLSCA